VEYLGIGVLDRDTRIGVTSDEGDGKQLSCLSSDKGILDWLLAQQAISTSNTGAITSAVNLAATELPSEHRDASDQVPPHYLW